jgi:EGF-like domain/Laminin EGF domain
MTSGSGDSVTLYFSFGFLQISDNGPCFSLKCSTGLSLGKDSEMIRDVVGPSTSYCFASKEIQASNCNPNALAKISSRNECICTHPYRGPLCEQCEEPVYIRTVDSTSNHTLCTLDATKCSSDLCNGHGSCLDAGFGTNPVCKCTSKYTGKFCERCQDS